MIKRALLMFGGFLLLMLLLLPSSRVSAASSQVSEPFNNFSASCITIVVTGDGVLHASCLTINGTQRLSNAIALNPHVGNINGVLTPNHNGFLFTCRNINGGFIPGDGFVVLDAFCLNGDKILVHTALDLNRFISNINGTLFWG